MTRSRLLIVVFISSILAPFVYFSSSQRPWQSDNFALLVWQEFLYRLDFTWHVAARESKGLWDHYLHLVEVEGENSMLRSRLAVLQARITDYEEQVEENRRLRKLLGFAEGFERRMLVAEVVGFYDHFPFHAVRISQGEHHGVRIGMPVIAADGIVGRVVRTGTVFSDVQLLVDANFNLDVLLQRTRVRGVLSGTAGENCKLNLHKRTEIRIGDTVITSGIVGGFPKGLPIGRVVRIAYDNDEVSQSITIEPWVDYRRLEEVMVLYHPDAELQKIIETAGNEWLRNSLRRVGG